MKKKQISILHLIPKKPSGISSGELILKLKLGTNRELREFNKEVQYQLYNKNISRNKDGTLSLYKYVKNSSSGNYSKEKKDFYAAPKKPRVPFKKSEPITSNASEDFMAICKEFKLPTIFTSSLQTEIQERLSLIEQTKEKQKRYDYQNDFIVTIDGEDAKDLDDAISLTKKQDSFLLTVHIADVSYYVAENSLTDKEAQKRGNSVYMINKVIPMLPEILSQQYCSLNPEETKHTLSCEMGISSQGELLSYQFKTGIIKTNYRLSYNVVQDILDQKQQHPDPKLINFLLQAKELALILKNKRLKEGSLDFYLPETKVMCDQEDNPTEFKTISPLFSMSIIEEFMLMANQAAATLLWKHKTGLFRIHESPSPEKLTEFYQTAKSIGVKIKPFRNSKEIQAFLSEPREPYLNTLLNQMLVRSMSQAQYHPKNIGHFGLGFSLYTHFTSPIRRYSDLLVHRQIKTILKIEQNSICMQPKYLSSVCKHISKTERTAMDAERQIQKIKAIRFLGQYPENLELKAHVSSIHSRGIFICLDDTQIEGMIPNETLPEYEYIEEIYAYKKRRASDKIKIGTPLMVKVYNLNLQKGFIDFILSSILENE